MVEILFIAQLARRPLQAMVVQEPFSRFARSAALPGMHEIVRPAFQRPDEFVVGLLTSVARRAGFRHEQQFANPVAGIADCCVA
jgi:hypothetical protein